MQRNALDVSVVTKKAITSCNSYHHKLSQAKIVSIAKVKQAITTIVLQVIANYNLLNILNIQQFTLPVPIPARGRKMCNIATANVIRVKISNNIPENNN